MKFIDFPRYFKIYTDSSGVFFHNEVLKCTRHFSLNTVMEVTGQDQNKRVIYFGKYMFYF